MERREKIESLDIVIKRRQNDPQLELFCSIPQIGEKRAKILYEKFGSIYNLCQASEDEISSLEDIGKKTAKTIMDTLKNEQ
jgi:ERCC4-type nuclease